MLYWMRIGLALIAAFLSLSLGFNSSSVVAYLAALVAALFYLVSLYIGKYVLKVVGRKLYTAGVGSYTMMFIFFWTLMNTLLLFS